MFNSYQDIFEKRADSYHRAMSDCPNARREEFAAAVSSLELFAGATLCDVPAGGGYLADFVDEPVDYVFLETSSYFAKRCLQRKHLRAAMSAIENLPLGDASLPRILSLAAVHHVMDKQKVVREFRRALTPGGIAVVADVEEGSGTAGFLNGFVNQFNSMGHDGRFLNDEFYRLIPSSGLKLLDVRRPALRWHFADVQEMVAFCTALFGLDLAAPADVLAGIEDHLGYAVQDNGVCMNWQLSYAVLQKPSHSEDLAQ